MSVNKVVAPVSIIILLFLTLISTTDNEIIAGEDIEFINGVSFVAPRDKFKKEPFEEIININANWVAIMPYAFTNGNSTEVIFDHERQWWGERSEGIVKTILHAQSNNLKVLLKPHVWVRGQGWTGDFKLETEEEWEAWEHNYEKYIMSFARLADSLEIDAFCIGLEYKNVVSERPGFWKRLIRKVRTNYSGKITYAANWDNYHNIKFWDQVDFIGINAYFPLSDKSNPEVEELKKAWKIEKSKIELLSEKFRKPIVFTEFGYRSIDKSTGNQWELESHHTYDGKPNFLIQQNGYQALFESFWEEEWFHGGFLWKWYPDYTGDFENTDYTPQHKPVENVIKVWYKKGRLPDQLN